MLNCLPKLTFNQMNAKSWNAQLISHDKEPFRGSHMTCRNKLISSPLVIIVSTSQSSYAKTSQKIPDDYY